MEWKNERCPDGRENRVEPAEDPTTPGGQSDSRDALLAQALAYAAARTNDVRPSEGFEARLMAAAAERKLFAPAVAAPATVERHVLTPRRTLPWVQRWAWAPVALAALALAFWIGTPRQSSPTTGAQPDPQTASVPTSAVPNLEAPISSGEFAGGTVRPREVASEGRPVQTASGVRPKRLASAVPLAGQIEPVPVKPAASAKASASEPPQPRVSEFVPLEFAAAFPAGEPLQTVRVRMDADAFLRWSLPGTAVGLSTQLAHNGRVTADFLVGDDGSPRAIRLVSMDE